MPYVKKEDRKNVRIDIEGDLTEGMLNFAITQLILKYLKQHGESYKTFNSIVGVLECAKQEFYRRMIAPYEDKKIKENGDVY